MQNASEDVVLGKVDWAFYLIFGDPLCTCHLILHMRSELCSLYNWINAIFADNMAQSSS